MSDESSEQPVFKSVEAYYAIAHTLQKHKEYKRVLFYIGLAMLLLGEIYFLRGDFEEALSAFHRGHKLRPTLEHFKTGIHKCEIAIKNYCLGRRINLSPSLDLTDFYMCAYPPKKKIQLRSVPLRERRPDSALRIADWPKDRDADLQKQLMQELFNEFTYLEDTYNKEGERLARLTSSKVAASHPMLEQVTRSNQVSAVDCGTFLDRHAELWHKLDPDLNQAQNRDSV